MNRQKLRKSFEEKTGESWINSQGEPDIDYVRWLESILSNLVKELEWEYYIDEWGAESPFGEYAVYRYEKGWYVVFKPDSLTLADKESMDGAMQVAQKHYEDKVLECFDL